MNSLSRFWLIIVNVLFLLGFFSIFLALIWESKEFGILSVILILSSVIINIKNDGRV